MYKFLLNLILSLFLYAPTYNTLITSKNFLGQELILAVANPDQTFKLPLYTSNNINNYTDLKNFLNKNIRLLQKLYDSSKVKDIITNKTIITNRTSKAINLRIPFHSDKNINIENLSTNNKQPIYSWITLDQVKTHLTGKNKSLALKALYRENNKTPIDYNITLDDFSQQYYKNTSIKLTGAGVIPIAKNPTTGEWMVLFGKEKYYNKHAKKNITAWRDMGGKLQSKDIVKSALLELYEETTGAFSKEKTKTDFFNKQQSFIAENRNKVIPITFARKQYASFFLPINFNDRSLQFNMKHNRKLLDKNKNHAFFETEDLKWISLEDILYDLKNGISSKIDGVPVEYRFVGGNQAFKNDAQRTRILNMIEHIIN